jgi:hypothetical protein
MSTLTETDAPLSTVPCWNIRVNLTPPEVVASRQLKSIRRLMVLSLLAFVVVAVVVYAGAVYVHHHAAAGLARENATTSSLEASRATYSDVTQINSSIAQVRGQLSGLMKPDVDLSALLVPVRAALSGDMRISQLQLTLQPVGAAVASGAGVGGSSLDTSGQQPIGTATVGGQASDFNDVSEFVARLKKLNGVINVDPATNTSTATGFQFTVNFTVTEDRLSHRFSPGGSGSR